MFFWKTALHVHINLHSMKAVTILRLKFVIYAINILNIFS
jgi:hypothetical protein